MHANGIKIERNQEFPTAVAYMPIVTFQPFEKHEKHGEACWLITIGTQGKKWPGIGG